MLKKMKKVRKVLAVGALALGVLASSGAFTTTTHAAELPKQASETAEFHQGEKPLKVYKSEATGVEIEVYAANPEDADKIRKERGWAKDEPVQIMHDKAEAEASNDVASAIGDTLGSFTAGLIQSFGTITAHASSGWDLVGTEYWLMSGSYSKVEVDAIHKSTGGDYEVRVPGFAERGSTPYQGKISFREYDPDNSDDYVGELEFYPSIYTTDYVMRDISFFANNEADGIAEFYTMHQANFYNAATSDGRINNVQYFD